MLTLMKAMEIAEDVFPEVEMSYDPTLSWELALIKVRYTDVEVENDETWETEILPDLLYQFEFMVRPRGQEEDLQIEKLQRLRGNATIMDMARIKKHFAHPHLRSIGEWTEICLGETLLQEKVAAFKHGEQVDEDNWHYICYMMDQLAYLESEHGGPYHYIHNLKDEREHLQEQQGQDQAPEFLEGNALVQFRDAMGGFNSITDSSYNRASGISNTWVEDFLNDPDRIQYHLDQLYEEGLLQRSGTTQQWFFGDAQTFTPAKKIGESEALRELRDAVIEYAGEPSTNRSYEFLAPSVNMVDGEPKFLQYMRADRDVPERLEYSVNPDLTYSFKDQFVWFKGQRLVPEITDEDDFGAIKTTNLQIETFTYHDSNYKTLKYFKDKINKEERKYECEDLGRYTDGLVEAARS